MKLLLKIIHILVIILINHNSNKVLSLDNEEMPENWLNSTELREEIFETNDYIPFKQELFKTKYILLIPCNCGAFGGLAATSQLPTIPTEVSPAPVTTSTPQPTGSTVGSAAPASLRLRKTKKAKRVRKKQKKNLNRKRRRRSRMNLFLQRQNRLQYLMRRYRRPTLFNVPLMSSLLGK